MPTSPLRTTVRFVLLALAATLAAGPVWAQQQPTPRPAPRSPAPNGAPHAGRTAPVPPPAPPSEFGLTLDLRHLQLRDDLVVPLVHRGFAPGLALTYAYRGPEHRHEARLGYAAGSPSSRDGHDADAYAFDAEYAYGYRVYAHEDPALHLFTGARAGGASDGAFYPRLDDAHAYWFTRYDFRPQVTAELVVDPRSRVSLNVSFPLFGLVSRPPDERLYGNDPAGFGQRAGKFHEDLQFRTLDSYAGVDVGLKYRYQVTKAVAESIEYRFAYASADEPRAVQVLTHSLRLGLYLDPWKW